MKDSLLKVYYPVKDYLLIILGTALYGFGYNAFILSNEIVTGGLSGICGLIFFATKLPVSVSYFAINVILASPSRSSGSNSSSRPSLASPRSRSGSGSSSLCSPANPSCSCKKSSCPSSSAP